MNIRTVLLRFDAATGLVYTWYFRGVLLQSTGLRLQSIFEV